MRFYVLTILVILMIPAFAQQKRSTAIDWAEPVLSSEGNYVQCVGCQVDPVHKVLYSEVKKVNQGKNQH